MYPRVERQDAAVTRQSQNARILAYLAKGGTLTPRQALRKFGTLRLAARCHELRRHGVVSSMVTRGGKRVACYRMAL